MSNLLRDEQDEIKALLEQLEKMESVEDSEGPYQKKPKSHNINLLPEIGLKFQTAILIILACPEEALRLTQI